MQKVGDRRMGVIRINKDRNYTVMSNVHLQDKRLSFKAKGMLSVMLSLPPEWDYSIAGLSTLSTDKKDSVMTILGELEQYGYLVRTRLTDKGKFAGWQYDIFEKPNTEKPNTEKPNTEKPNTEKPNTEKPPQLNTEPIKELNQSIIQQISTEQVQAVVRLFNETCTSFSKVTAVSADRKKHISARLKQYGVEKIKLVFQKAEASSFLKGDNNRKWKANFDWLLNETNFAKVLDGNYDDKHRNGSDPEQGESRKPTTGQNVNYGKYRRDSV